MVAQIAQFTSSFALPQLPLELRCLRKSCAFSLSGKTTAKRLDCARQVLWIMWSLRKEEKGRGAASFPEVLIRRVCFDLCCIGPGCSYKSRLQYTASLSVCLFFSKLIWFRMVPECASNVIDSDTQVPQVPFLTWTPRLLLILMELWQWHKWPSGSQLRPWILFCSIPKLSETYELLL